MAGLGALLLVAGGCGVPVGVKRVGPRTVQRELTRNVLTVNELSEPTQNVLRRHVLAERFDEDPAGTLAELHRLASEGGDSDEIFTAAETSFLYGERSGKRHYLLAAAVYAYAFLFPDGAGKPPDPYDPRFRTACDLYNRGLTEALKSADASLVVLQSGTYGLPFGEIEVEFDRSQLEWAGRELVDFSPVAEYEVRGLRNRYRRAGIGAPLAAGVRKADSAKGDDFLTPGVRIPVNVLLRIENARQNLAEGRLRGTLELRTVQEAAAEVGDRSAPLEIETTSSLAYMLAESPFWERELKGFLLGDLLAQNEEPRLSALLPYQRGLIPVVFVHGTASSPARWAEMLNDLWSDPRIFDHFQFWFFTYDTGNPIAYSAGLLRESLREAVARFDPEGSDPALRQMVVIGHSQGGLLTKMTAIHSGNRLWDTVSRVPLDKLTLSKKSRQLIRQSMFIEPLPFVSRVVFIATPHRGSFIAGSRISHWTARLIKLPTNVVHLGSEILQGNPDYLLLRAQTRMPTAVDNMTPGNPFCETLASIPVAPDVKAHSIIAVQGDGPVQDGDDGVVEYASAHLDGVVSELVVRSSHSVQSSPVAIEEVRRILLLHLAETEGRLPAKLGPGGEV